MARKLSLEHRQKISAANAGRIVSRKTKDKIRAGRLLGRNEEGRRKAAAEANRRRALPLGRANRNSVLCQYHLNASNRGLEWALTDAEFDTLTLADCFYCGAPPSNRASQGDLNGAFVYNGIDRRNNALGYVSGNCVSCCRTCNLMKHNLEEQEFYAHVERVYQHTRSRFTRSAVSGV